jgi:hypothetical protein
MSTIGDKIVVVNETFIARDDDTVVIEVLINAYLTAKFIVRFHSKNDGQEPLINTRSEGSNFYIDFLGWKKASDTVLDEPQIIGRLQDEPLYMQIVHRQLSGTNLFVFQVTQGRH